MKKKYKGGEKAFKKMESYELPTVIAGSRNNKFSQY